MGEKDIFSPNLYRTYMRGKNMTLEGVGVFYWGNIYPNIPELRMWNSRGISILCRSVSSAVYKYKTAVYKYKTAVYKYKTAVKFGTNNEIFNMTGFITTSAIRHDSFYI